MSADKDKPNIEMVDNSAINELEEKIKEMKEKMKKAREDYARQCAFVLSNFNKEFPDEMVDYIIDTYRSLEVKPENRTKLDDKLDAKDKEIEQVAKELTKSIDELYEQYD